MHGRVMNKKHRVRVRAVNLVVYERIPLDNQRNILDAEAVDAHFAIFEPGHHTRCFCGPLVRALVRSEVVKVICALRTTKQLCHSR
jgi:hypothetical protein